MENALYKTEGENKKYNIQGNLIVNAGTAFAQKAHQDYKQCSSSVKSKCNDKALPYSVFFGLCPNTTLLVCVDNKWQIITYGPGDVIFIAGDCIHAGTTCREPNCKFQVFMDTQEIKHNPQDSNEWLHWNFGKQPLAYEIRHTNLHNADSFFKEMNDAQLKSLYKISKDDIMKTYYPNYTI